MAIVDELTELIGETETEKLASLASVFDKINVLEAENEAYKTEIEKTKAQNESLRENCVTLLQREFSRKAEPEAEEQHKEVDIIDMSDEEFKAYLDNKNSGN